MPPRAPAKKGELSPLCDAPAGAKTGVKADQGELFGMFNLLQVHVCWVCIRVHVYASQLGSRSAALFCADLAAAPTCLCRWRRAA